MALSKKFLDAVSKDPALKAEVDNAVLGTLNEFLKARGLTDEAGKATASAMEKIAEAHGFKAEAMEEVDEDEMKAVAGGGTCSCEPSGSGSGWVFKCTCEYAGAGSGGGACVCAYTGVGAGL